VDSISIRISISTYYY